MGLEPQVNIREPDRVLSIFDNAINQETSDLAAYELRHDLIHLRLLADDELEELDLAGKRPSPPVWFTIRAFADGEVARTMKQCGGDVETGMDEAFRLCCLNVENLRAKHPKTGVLEDIPYLQDKKAIGCRRMGDLTFSSVPQKVRQEMVGHAMQMSGLGDLRKNSSARTASKTSLDEGPTVRAAEESPGSSTH